MMPLQEISALNEKFFHAEPEEALRYFLTAFEGRIALSSSLSLEDQVLTAMIAGIKPKTRIFTLDTGRLFPESYQLIDRTFMKYKISIEIFFPDAVQVEKMVNRDGINLFYESIEKRKLCCQIRKIEPLRRAFQGLEVWVCGIRHQQSVTRKEMQLVEWDEVNGLLKLNPLIHWSEEQVWSYIRQHQVPYNTLHDKGYPSIGCEPCTRPVQPGENIRAGRWWWESPDHKECGLHRR